MKIKWHKVFESADAAKDSVKEKEVVKVMAGDQYLCFTRIGNDFFAFGDSCPHQGKPMTQASCNEDFQVICPFHKYAFNLKTGRGEGLYLPVYPVNTDESGVFIGMERSAWDFF